MKTKIKYLLSQNNQLLDQAGAMIEKPDTWLAGKGEEDWTRHELLYHLYLTEKGTLAYLKKKMAEEVEPPKASFKSHLRSYLLNRFMKSKTRKAKAPKIADPRQNKTPQDVSQLVDQFRDLRDDWYQFVDSQRELYWKKAVFRHPYAGRLNGEQMMNFVNLHFQRHLDQMKDREG